MIVADSNAASDLDMPSYNPLLNFMVMFDDESSRKDGGTLVGY